MGRFEGATIPIPGIPGTRQSRRIGKGTPSGESVRPALQDTGGEVPGDKFRDEFPQMLRRIRGRYLLGSYAPPSDARRFHTIQVTLTNGARERHPNALIRARRGYYSRPSSTR